MDRGIWKATVSGLQRVKTQLSNYAHKVQYIGNKGWGISSSRDE